MRDNFQIVLNGGVLTQDEARLLLTSLLSGNIDESLLSAFLTAYIIRPIQSEELAGFREALLSLATPVDLSDFDIIDCCGTGGDGKDTFNISTLSAFVLAGCGKKVAKHGNYASSSLCGSSNILEACGAKLLSAPESIKHQLDQSGIAYMHAPYFHPALKGAARVRKMLGRATIFNLLGPLANPARPKKQFVGVMNQTVAKLYSEALSRAGLNYVIIHSLDGYDEISLTSDIDYRSPQSETIISLGELGLPAVNPNELSGGRSLEEATKIFMSVLKNESSQEKQAVVCANAAFALQIYEPELSFTDAYLRALEALRSGRALCCFEKFREEQ